MAYSIKGFNPATFIDWEGKLACVIYLAGCNFRCRYCHSHSLIFEPDLLPDISFEQIRQFLQEKKGWLDGVIIGGGEPTLYEDLFFLLKEIKDFKFLIKLDTNGSNPQIIKQLLAKGLVDYIAMDIKAPLEIKRYESVVGVEVDINKIKTSIDILLNSKIDYEFRTTVVPTLLTQQDILKISQSISGAKKYVLQQFNPKDALDDEMSKVIPYPLAELTKCAELAKEFVRDSFVRGK